MYEDWHHSRIHDSSPTPKPTQTKYLAYSRSGI